MSEKSNGVKPGGRPRYALRTLATRSRLIRDSDLDMAARADNVAGVPYPARGRRRWLEQLARARYEAANAGWKSRKR